jgi:hypothetical protein
MQTLLHLLPGRAAGLLFKVTPSKALLPVLYLCPCTSREYRLGLSETPL